jgi:hypothetical protein
MESTGLNTSQKGILSRSGAVAHLSTSRQLPSTPSKSGDPGLPSAWCQTRSLQDSSLGVTNHFHTQEDVLLP